MVVGIQRVYETKLRSPKKKKKKKKMVSTYIRARFGPISPKSKHEKSDLQKSLHRLHGLEFFVEYTKFSKIAKGIPRKKRLKSTDLNNALLCSDG